MKSSPIPSVLALSAALGVAGIAHANGNPFVLNTLAQAYQVAANDKTTDGKCGEGKCGTKKESRNPDGKGAPDRESKARDGKCGEGKCGAKK